MENNNNYDMVAIGDIVVDAFIRLEDAEVTCKLNNEDCELCVRYGDKVPYESVEVLNAVGNSANAAVSGARLGLHTALIATVGNDENGKACLAELEKNKVATEYMKTNNDFPTNYHYVLWYDVERTILVKHAPFPYSLPANMPAPKWIYLSSMGETSVDYHHEIAKYLKENPQTKLAFQPGTFQMKLGVETLKDIYETTDLFFCNVEEAERILKTTAHDTPQTPEGKKMLMKKLSELGPKQVVMTDGFAGAYAYDGEKYFFMPIYPHAPVERTGAGDAFASTIASCLAMGMTLAEAFTWAPINAMSVTQQVGAQKGLLTKEKILELLSKAPSDYKLNEI